MRALLLLAVLAWSLPGVAQNLTLSRLFGRTLPGPNGQVATAFPLFTPAGVAYDNTGRLYFSDSAVHAVIRINADGRLELIAGTGISGFSGDGGPANQASLNNPQGLAFDGFGNLFIADYDNQRIRRVAANGTITTVAGNGDLRFNGDNLPALQTALDPWDLFADAQGTLYVVDYLNNRVRRIRDGLVTVIAGNGQGQYSPATEGGPATAAALQPESVAVDRNGLIYIADDRNNRVYRLAADGTLTTAVGTGSGTFNGDGLAPNQTNLSPVSLAIDSTNAVLIADPLNNRIRRFDPVANQVRVLAGTNRFAYLTDNQAPVDVAFIPSRLATRGNDVAAADLDNRLVYRVGPTVTAVAGIPVGNTTLDRLFLYAPGGLAVDNQGRWYVADTGRNVVWRVDLATSQVTLIAGVGVPGRTLGAAVIANTAPLDGPEGLAIDAQGNLFIADTGNGQIRRIAGANPLTPLLLFAGANAPTPATFTPHEIAFDPQGNLLVAATEQHRVLRIDPQGGVITIAGNGTAGSTGDGGPAAQAQLNGPHGVAADRQGNVFIAEIDGHRLRRVATEGTITTVAGNGNGASTGNGGPASQASLNAPWSVRLDSTGAIYVTEPFSFLVRRIGPDGRIGAVAGNGTPLPLGDNRPALATGLVPLFLAIDARDNVVVNDGVLGAVYRLTPDAPLPQLTIRSGDAQSALAGNGLPNPLVVQVRFGTNTFAGVPVTFRITQGSGTLSTAAVLTAPDGTATTNLRLGNTTGEVRITAALATGASVEFRATANSAVPEGQRPAISANGVVGAGLSTPAVTTITINGIASVFGQRFVPGTDTFGAQLNGGRLATNVGNTCVFVNGFAAPLFFVSAGQINFQVPALGSATSATVEVASNCGQANEVRSNGAVVSVAGASPEFFTVRQFPDGRSALAAIDPLTGGYLGAPNLLAGASFTPARPGQVIALFATGLGVTSPRLQPGELASSAAPLLASPQVRFGATTLSAADVLYAGAAPGFAGLYQINIRVPDNTQPGDIPVTITTGGISSPAGTFLTVR